MSFANQVIAQAFSGDRGRQLLQDISSAGVMGQLTNEQIADVLLGDNLSRNQYNALTSADFADVADSIGKIRESYDRSHVQAAADPEAQLRETYKLRGVEKNLLKSALKADPKYMLATALLAAASEGAGIIGDVGGMKHYNKAKAIQAANPGMSKQLPSPVAARAATAAAAENYLGQRSQRIGQGVSNLLNSLRGELGIANNDLRTRYGQLIAPISTGAYDFERTLNKQQFGGTR